MCNAGSCYRDGLLMFALGGSDDGAPLTSKSKVDGGGNPATSRT